MERNWKKILFRSLSYVLVATLASLGTFFVCGQNTKLAQLETVIKTYFIGEADMDAAEDAAAKAMIGALGDRWSYYVSAREYADYEERKNNAYVGIGISIVAREDGTGFDIVSVEPDGPAQQAGILPGDVLVEVEGTSMEGVSSDVPVGLIRGKAGTQVSLVVLRDGQRLVLQVRRSAIQSVVAESEMLENNIGYVRINNFNTNCADQTITCIDALVEQGAQALVFDVRNNAGGYVEEMNRILDYLLPEGDLFRSVRYNGREQVDTSDEACLKLPMAVLVNEYSYSAAEFFAAALQEYQWASVVGTPTTGKGYFQNTFRFHDGSAVALSVGQYYTPKGVSLAQQGGLQPDVTVAVDEETFAMIYAGLLPPQEDPQIQAAVTKLE